MAGQEHPVGALLEDLVDFRRRVGWAGQRGQRSDCRGVERGRERRVRDQCRQRRAQRVERGQVITTCPLQVFRLDQAGLNAIGQHNRRRPIHVLGLDIHLRDVVRTDAREEGHATAARREHPRIRGPIREERQPVGPFPVADRIAGEVLRRQEHAVVLTPRVLGVEQVVAIARRHGSHRCGRIGKAPEIQERPPASEPRQVEDSGLVGRRRGRRADLRQCRVELGHRARIQHQIGQRLAQLGGPRVDVERR